MQRMLEAGPNNAPPTRPRVAATRVVLAVLVALAPASSAFTSTARTASTARTNATGAFAFDGVETGGYRLRVRYRETDASGQVDVQ